MNSNNTLTTKTKVAATMTVISSAPMSLSNVVRLPFMCFSRRAKAVIISLFLLLGVTAAQAGTELYFVHGDHLGTAKVITNQNQDVVWQADYTPFGEVVETSNQTEYRQRFPGQYQDDETGFYYNYYRDYDPSIGRYIQSDPIGLGGGLNTFAYVSGNPLTYIDPLGLSQMNRSSRAPGTLWKNMTCAQKQASVARQKSIALNLILAPIPIGRAAYIFQASKIPGLANTARQAVGLRNKLKWKFRGLMAKYLANWHKQTYSGFVRAAKSPSNIIAGSGRTSTLYNSALVGGGAAGILAPKSSSNSCGCP